MKNATAESWRASQMRHRLDEKPLFSRSRTAGRNKYQPHQGAKQRRKYAEQSASAEQRAA